MKLKILGCLLGAAAGDAMGSATERKSFRQIASLYGGRVTDFHKPPEDGLARGRQEAQITDAFSIPYFLLKEILLEKGVISRKVSCNGLAKWGQSDYFEPFAGMTTRKVINRLKADSKVKAWDYAGHLGNKLFKGHYYALSSNGAANKAFPAALFSNGDVDLAIKNAMEIAMGSHDDPYSIAGACAIAAAINEALKQNTTIYHVVNAGLYGARQGEALARERQDIEVYPGPSVTKRISLAIKIALSHDNPKDSLQELREIIGSGPAMAETVPMAFGIFVAQQGNLLECIFDGVNVGDETCAIASILGGIAGAYHGAQAFPVGWQSKIEVSNKIDLSKMTDAIIKTLQIPVI